MILYFTGTGNSRWVAEKLQSITGDALVSMNSFIKKDSCRQTADETSAGSEGLVLHSDTPFVFVAPIYSWRMPKVVSQFIENTRFTGSDKAYAVLTCGTDAGNALKYSRELFEGKGFQFLGQASVVMPGNYIAMFNVPDPAESEEIISAAAPVIERLGEAMKREELLPPGAVSLLDRMKSGFGNSIFYKAAVKAKGFRYTEKCTGCETCVALCPLNNVEMAEGRPRWGKDCTHCMACICGCPEEAIEYKNKTKGKRRYYLK